MRVRRSTPAVLVLALLALACGGGDTPDVPPPGDAAGGAAGAPAPPPGNGMPELAMSPTSGPPGTEVRVAMGNLIISSRVELAFGGLGAHEMVANGNADRNGDFEATVRVPAGTPPGVAYFFLVDAESAAPVSAPAAFTVTGGAAAAGAVTVTARITDEGVECTAARDGAGKLYTLTGVDDIPEAGTNVVIEGTVAEMSTCQQGTTIAVTSLRALP